MSFFNSNYKTPAWLTKKLARRQVLKAAAGATAIAAAPKLVLAQSSKIQLEQALKTDPWLSLQAVLEQLLPESDTGPGAKSLNATAYLFNVVNEQPIEPEEKSFIFKGIGWLNGFAQSQLKKNFVELTFDEKEQILKGISKSRAGHNWLNTLITYLYEAMLTPPSYGGNPDGIGWQWLDHQGGFPLPPKGKRFYELPGVYKISVKNVTVEEKRKA